MPRRASTLAAEGVDSLPVPHISRSCSRSRNSCSRASFSHGASGEAVDDRRGERARVAALAERSGTVRLGDVISRLCGGGLPFTPRNRSSTESCDSRTNPFVLLLKGPLGPPALRSSWADFSRGMDRSKLVRSTVEPGLNPCPKKLCMEPELAMNLDPRPSY